MTARPALGRGLNALIPHPRSERPDAAAPPRTLPVAAIQPNPGQPRSHIEAAALEELAASIREHGVLQPLLVARSADDRYVMVAGERRWRAAQLAGLTEVPVLITDLADADRLSVALVENIQREDLSPLEEAHAYRRLMEEGPLTQEQVAKRVGKSRVAVANSLRLLQLPAPIRMSLAAGEISEGHARAILGAPTPDHQIRLWKRVRERHLTVRQAESAARTLRSVGPATTARRRDLPGDRLAQERLQSALGTQVQVHRGRRGGHIQVRWYDDEQLEQIVNAIVRAAAEPVAAPPERIHV